MIILIRWFEVLASAFRRTYRLTLIFLLTYPHLLLYFTRPSVFLCRTYLVPYNLIAILHIPNYYSDPYYQTAYKIALFHGCFYKLPIQIYHKKTFSIIKPGYFINLIFRIIWFDTRQGRGIVPKSNIFFKDLYSSKTGIAGNGWHCNKDISMREYRRHTALRCISSHIFRHQQTAPEIF